MCVCALVGICVCICIYVYVCVLSVYVVHVHVSTRVCMYASGLRSQRRESDVKSPRTAITGKF